MKIGGSTRVVERRSDLQTANAENLVVLGVFTREGATWRELEREMHTRFAEHRLRGEWFHWCPEIERFIAEHCNHPHPTAEKEIRPVQNGNVSAGELTGEFTKMSGQAVQPASLDFLEMLKKMK